MKKNPAIILVGIKHSGKSTLGKLLANKLNCPFVDVDTVITKITGSSPRDVYLFKGPKGFMDAELNACIKIYEQLHGKPVVIATGGGICDNPEAILKLSSMGRFVMINAPLKLVCDRVFAKAKLYEDGTWEGLPAYIQNENPKTEKQAKDIFTQKMTERVEAYKKLSDLVFEPTKDSIEENVAKLAYIL